MLCLMFFCGGGADNQKILFFKGLFPFEHFVPKGKNPFQVCVVELNHICQSGLGAGGGVVFLSSKWQWLCNAEIQAGVWVCDMSLHGPVGCFGTPSERPPLCLSESSMEKERETPSPIDPNCVEVDVNFNPDPADLVLSSVPGGELFNPRKHKFAEEDLKPQPMIKKAKKVFVPDEQKVTWCHISEGTALVQELGGCAFAQLILSGASSLLMDTV